MPAGSESPTHRVAGLWRALAAAAFIAALPGAAPASAPMAPAAATAAEAGEFDADLARVSGRDARAEGVLLFLAGRVTDAAGREVADARVELWHRDASGRDPADDAADPGFQGYGRMETAANGRYRFRTIRPGADEDEAPHLNLRVSAPGFGAMALRLYFAGEPGNADDPYLRRLPAEVREALTLVPEDASAIEPGALQAVFDIVLPFNESAPT